MSANLLSLLLLVLRPALYKLWTHEVQWFLSLKLLCPSTNIRQKDIFPVSVNISKYLGLHSVDQVLLSWISTSWISIQNSKRLSFLFVEYCRLAIAELSRFGCDILFMKLGLFNQLLRTFSQFRMRNQLHRAGLGGRVVNGIWQWQENWT